MKCSRFQVANLKRGSNIQKKNLISMILRNEETTFTKAFPYPKTTTKMPSKRDKDATRSERKAKRRAAEDQIPDIPGEIDEDLNSEEPKEKKRKRDDTQDDEKRVSKKLRNNEDGTTTEQESARKSKKERKAERKALKAAEKDSATEEAGELDDAGKDEEVLVEKSKKKKKKSKTPKTESQEKTGKDESTKTPPRFVVFVGKSIHSSLPLPPN